MFEVNRKFFNLPEASKRDILADENNRYSARLISLPGITF